MFFFMSYSHEDAELAHRLHQDLQAQGIKVWIDHERLIPGTPDWENGIRESLRSATGVILLASPQARQSSYVRDELDLARMHKLPIYPFWIAGQDWIDSVPLGLGRTQYIDAREAHYNQGLSQLIMALSPSTVFFPSPLDHKGSLPSHRTSKQGSTAKIWGIGQRQLLFMTLGAFLYGGSNYITNTANLSFRPGVVIPIFFGAVFGPWVGLFSGGVGNLLGDSISGYGFYGNWDIGNALIGFVAGLALYITRGRYNMLRNIFIADIFGVVGVLFGIGLAAYFGIWISKYTWAAASGNFIHIAQNNAISAFILLPILLAAYNAVVRSRECG